MPSASWITTTPGHGPSPVGLASQPGIVPPAIGMLTSAIVSVVFSQRLCRPLTVGNESLRPLSAF